MDPDRLEREAAVKAAHEGVKNVAYIPNQSFLTAKKLDVVYHEDGEEQTREAILLDLHGRKTEIVEDPEEYVTDGVECRNMADQCGPSKLFEPAFSEQ